MVECLDRGVVQLSILVKLADLNLNLPLYKHQLPMVECLDHGVVQLSILLKLANLNLPLPLGYLSPHQLLSPVID